MGLHYKRNVKFRKNKVFWLLKPRLILDSPLHPYPCPHRANSKWAVSVVHRPQEGEVLCCLLRWIQGVELTRGSFPESVTWGAARLVGWELNSILQARVTSQTPPAAWDISCGPVIIVGSHFISANFPLQWFNFPTIVTHWTHRPD